MKNKELVTELAARMGWTAQEVTETLSVLSSVVSSRLVFSPPKTCPGVQTRNDRQE